MLKKFVLFVGIVLCAGVVKAEGWFDGRDNSSSDQYTVYYASAPMAVSASTTVVLVALSSNTWAHPTGQKAIVVDTIQIDNDKTAATTSIVKVGVIREINASSGTIVWFERVGQGINVSNTNTFQLIKYDGGINCKVVPVSVPGGSNIGSTPYLLSNDLTQGSSALTINLPLPSVVTTGIVYKPRVGDIVANITNSAVAANLTIMVRYHTEN